MKIDTVVFFAITDPKLYCYGVEAPLAAIENLTRNRTTFVVAHRLSTIKNADKIAVVKDGRCVETGTFSELMDKKGEFYKFKQIQS